MNQTIYPIGIQNFEKIRSRIMMCARKGNLTNVALASDWASV